MTAPPTGSPARSARARRTPAATPSPDGVELAGRAIAARTRSTSSSPPELDQSGLDRVELGEEERWAVHRAGARLARSGRRHPRHRQQIPSGRSWRGGGRAATPALAQARAAQRRPRSSSCRRRRRRRARALDDDSGCSRGEHIADGRHGAIDVCIGRPPVAHRDPHHALSRCQPLPEPCFPAGLDPGDDLVRPTVVVTVRRRGSGRAPD